MTRGPSFWQRAEGAPARIVGHRGAKGSAPENTLGAFAQAIADGATAVELDVRTCASGDLVVFHDPTLARMTGERDGRRVADLSFTELSRVRLAGGERVPLLAEVLALLRPRGIGVNVEMKHDVPDPAPVVRATAALLLASPPEHPVLASSFDPRMLLALARLAPSLPRALIVHRSRYHPFMLASVGPRGGRRPIGVDAVHLERVLATPRRVADLRARGLLLGVWTVNDPSEAAALSALKVDNILTDVPIELRDRV